MEFCFWDFLRNIRKKTSLSSAGSHHQTAVHTDLKNAKNAIRMAGVFYLIYTFCSKNRAKLRSAKVWSGGRRCNHFPRHGRCSLPDT